MNTIREFFVNLRKSTKITLISCVSFVLMTFLILCFFIISPITPDDKAGSTYGRETVSGSVIRTDVTTIAGEGLEVSKGTSKAATTTKVTTSHVDYVITITTGAGFYTGGRINTGDYTGDYDYNQNGNYNAEEEQGGIGYYDPNSSVNNNNGSGNASGNGENGNGGETGYNNNGGETGNGNNGGNPVITITAVNQAMAITAAEMLPVTAVLQTAVNPVITITAERQATATAAETQFRNSRYRLRNSRYRILLKAAEKLLVQMNNK